MVHDPLLLDQHFTTLWDGMNQELLAQNRERALSYVLGTERVRMGAIFDALMPDYANVIGSISALSRGKLQSGYVEYFVTRDQGEERDAFTLYYMRGTDGVWRLESL